MNLQFRPQCLVGMLYFFFSSQFSFLICWSFGLLIFSHSTAIADTYRFCYLLLLGTEGVSSVSISISISVSVSVSCCCWNPKRLKYCVENTFYWSTCECYWEYMFISANSNWNNNGTSTPSEILEVLAKLKLTIFKRVVKILYGIELDIC